MKIRRFIRVTRWFFYPLLLVLVGCSDGPRLRSAPATLAGLELHHQLSGERALGAVHRLHGAAEIELADAWIAQYGFEVSALLYVAIGRSPADADSLLGAIRRRIAEGNSPFQGIRDTRLFGTDIYLMSGQGQLHFLYQDREQVVLLSATPPVACAALAEILGAGDGEEGCSAAGI